MMRLTLESGQSVWDYPPPKPAPREDKTGDTNASQGGK
jgi:hypothetical protein